MPNSRASICDDNYQNCQNCDPLPYTVFPDNAEWDHWAVYECGALQGSTVHLYNKHGYMIGCEAHVFAQVTS